MPAAPKRTPKFLHSFSLRKADFGKIFEREMCIVYISTIILQIFWGLQFYLQVISNFMKDPDNIIYLGDPQASRILPISIH